MGPLGTRTHTHSCNNRAGPNCHTQSWDRPAMSHKHLLPTVGCFPFLRNRAAQKALHYCCWFSSLRSSPAETHVSETSLSQERSVLMHSCTCLPFQARPHFLSPPLAPWKVVCFATDKELNNARKQPRSVPGCCITVQPACQPSICGTETENSVMDKMDRSLLWLFLHKRSPTRMASSSLAQLRDKGMQRNIVPSRSPPGLTSRLLLIYGSVGSFGVRSEADGGAWLEPLSWQAAGVSGHKASTTWICLR